MKRILYKTSILFLTILFIVSCDKFLEEDPRSLIAPDNFYNSDLELKAAVNGIYATYFRDDGLYNVVGLSRFYEFGSDEINPNRLGGEGLVYSLYTVSEGVNESRNTWQALYRVIQDCNLLLNRMTDNANISEETAAVVGGEVLFLRALAYYHLTNLWGDVPYYREYLPIEEVQVL